MAYLSWKMENEEAAESFLKKHSIPTKYNDESLTSVLFDAYSDNSSFSSTKRKKVQEWFLNKIKSPSFIIFLYVVIPCVLICMLFTNPNATYIISPSNCNLERIPSSVLHIIVKDESCNSQDIQYVDFSKFKDLRSIEIGNSCFVLSSFFRVFDMSSLQSIKIGDNCFDTSGEKKKFRISKTPKLTSLVIGKNSFTHFSQFLLMG